MSHTPLVRTVNNFAELRLIQPASLPQFGGENARENPVIDVLGFYTKGLDAGVANVGDGGGGRFQLDLTSTATLVPGMVEAPASGPGRWLRMWDQTTLHALWFGVVADGNVRLLTNGSVFVDNACTIPSTDNTAAMQRCFDWAQMMGTKVSFNASAPGTIVDGYRIGHPTVVLPPGGIYIGAARNLLSAARIVRPAGVQMGFRIEGQGMGNTVLWCRDIGAGPTDFVFNDVSLGRYWELAHFSVIGTTGDENFWRYEGLNGYGAGLIMRDIDVQTKRGLSITGTVQSDTMHLANLRMFCTEYCVSIDNGQSVGNSMVGCHLTASGPTAVGLKILVGGTVVATGGAWQSELGATLVQIKAPGHNTGLQLRPNILMIGTKPEVHDSAKLFDIDGGDVIIQGAPLHTLPGNTGNRKMIVRHQGSIHLRDCAINVAMSAALVTTGFPGEWNTDDRALITVEGGSLDYDWLSTVGYFEDDALTVPFNDVDYTGIGRVVVDGVKGSQTSILSLGPTVNWAVNGAPYHYRSFTTLQPKHQAQTFVFYDQANNGLPDTAGVSDLIIPKGCTIKSVRISKRAGFTSTGLGRVWQVANLSGLVLATLTVTSAGEVKTVVADVDVLVDTIAQRTLRLTCVTGAGGHYADGYAEVIYI
jgi:hypothetical protein